MCGWHWCGSGRIDGRGLVEAYAGDGGGGGERLFERIPVEMADEATGATIKLAEVLVIPKCGGDVGDDKAEASPEEDDGEAVNAFCEEKVDEKSEN